MTFWRDLLRGQQPKVLAVASEVERAALFSTNIDSGVLYGTLTPPDPWGVPGQRVTRREAICVPAVNRARDRIAGGLGQLPIRMYGPDDKPVAWSLLDQPEDGIPSTITWTSVVDDLLFHGTSWLKVTHVGWHGKPAEVVRLDPSTVTVQPDTKVHHSRTGNGSALHWPEDPQLIRIVSPNDPLLVVGARAIRALTRLEQAALNFAEGVPPQDFFTPDGEADPFEDDDEVADFLDGWMEARKLRGTAYVPKSVKYNANTGFNPEQLQLTQAREMAIGEIARLTGVDTEDLGVSTTSRTYFNAQDRRRQFVDFVLAPYMRAIESRLSMDDVTPRGYRVRFDLTDFLRADDREAAEIDQILIGSKVLQVNEVRQRRGLEPRDIPTDDEDMGIAAPRQEVAS